MKTTTIFGRGICTGCGHDIALNQDGTVRCHRGHADIWCDGSRRAPKPVVPADPRRAQWIADARAVLDLLESNPELPLNLVSGPTISYYPLNADNDAKSMAAVDAVAKSLGVAVMPPGPGSHYEAEIRFGSASYKAVAVLTDYRERRRAIERLGEAALDAEDNARIERDYEAHEANEAWLDAHPDEFVSNKDGAL